jgi:mevalonate kinase
MTTSSAPGKIILFGEHAVVYGRPALAVPVTQIHVDVEVSDSDHAGIWINAPAIDLHAEVNTLPSNHPIASVINKIIPPLSSPHFQTTTKMGGQRGVEVNISSTIPVASGLGSGAAVSVALIRALSSSIHRPLSDEQVNAFAYEIEKLHHGTPSGIDNTVITYAMPVYFIKGQPIETFKVGNPFTIVIADTGKPAPTKESVGDVRRLWMNNRSRWETVFDKIGVISFTAKRAIEFCKQTLSEIKGRELLGELMNENHAYLQEMNVSSRELDMLIEAARSAGALGAKMSGGGRGGNMIAIVEKESAQKVVDALLNAGAKNTIITQVT